MRFGLEDEQLEFADAVRRALTDGCPPDVIRAAWEGKELDTAIWSTLLDMGTTDPGLDWVTRIAVAEEIGRAALPHPWMETSFVVGPVLSARGDNTAGVTMATTDLGTPGRAPCAADAEILLVAGTGLRLADATDVEVTPVHTVDGARRMGTISVRSATPAPATTVDPLLAGTLGTAALLLGLGQHLLDTTVSYVSERQQFGRPVGSFQAVKHHLANTAKDLAFARPLVLRAAYGLDSHDPNATRDVSVAKAMASDAATLAAETALQCHGAIGYTVEYDLHLWLKRVWALARAWGDATHHRSRVAEHLGLVGSGNTQRSTP